MPVASGDGPVSEKKFTVAPSDWSSLTTWLDGIGVGQPFSNDANDKQYYYLSYDNATNKVTYAFHEFEISAALADGWLTNKTIIAGNFKLK